MRWQLFRFNMTLRNTKKWPTVARQMVEAKAAEGWELVSTSSFRDTDGDLIEILWMKRPLPAVGAEPEHGWLGFGPPDAQE